MPNPRRRPRRISLKEARFVKEYLIDLNATAATFRAGYAAQTPLSASVTGARILARPVVQEALQRALAARNERIEVRADDVLRHLLAVALSDMRGLASWGPNKITLRDSGDLTPMQALAVSEITEGPHGVRIKLHDKGNALTLLMRHLGLLPTTRIVRDAEGRLAAEIPGGEGGEGGIVIYLPDNGRGTPQNAPQGTGAPPLGAPNGAAPGSASLVLPDPRPNGQGH